MLPAHHGCSKLLPSGFKRFRARNWFTWPAGSNSLVRVRIARLLQSPGQRCNTLSCLRCTQSDAWTACCQPCVSRSPYTAAAMLGRLLEKPAVHARAIKTGQLSPRQRFKQLNQDGEKKPEPQTRNRQVARWPLIVFVTGPAGSRTRLERFARDPQVRFCQRQRAHQVCPTRHCLNVQENLPKLNLATVPVQACDLHRSRIMQCRACFVQVLDDPWNCPFAHWFFLATKIRIYWCETYRAVSKVESILTNGYRPEIKCNHIFSKSPNQCNITWYLVLLGRSWSMESEQCICCHTNHITFLSILNLIKWHRMCTLHLWLCDVSLVCCLVLWWQVLKSCDVAFPVFFNPLANDIITVYPSVL